MTRDPSDIFHVRFLSRVPGAVKPPKKINVDFRFGVLVGVGCGMLGSFFLSIILLMLRNV